MRCVRALVLWLATAFAFPAAADFPEKPIRLIVPQAPGSATDTVARILGVELGKELGQQIVVDNRPGGALTIGLDLTAKAEPDGYTICMGPVGALAITRHMVAKLPYDIERDFQPIALVARGHLLLAGAPDAPFRTLAELIEYAKKNPGKLNYASSGNGTIVQLTAELFKAQAGVFVTHIPYKGTALAIPDLISGKIDVLFDSLPTGMPHVRDGRLRALGVTSLDRSPLAPELPAIADVLPGFESNTWFGLYAPKGLPADLLARINAAANESVSDPEVRDKLSKLGIAPATGTPARFAAMVAQDSAKWKKIITERKIISD
jgi:tripartite-type tricarboxylate transporter receptor subunit TctC